MDRAERSSKRSREDRDRDRSLSSSKDHHRDSERDRDHKQRHHRDVRQTGNDREDGKDSTSRKSKDERRRDGERHHHRQERSRSEDRDRGSVERGRDYSREESVERVSSRKRKEYGDGEVDGSERKERKRRFEDRVAEDPRSLNGSRREDGRKDRKYKERGRSEERRDVDDRMEERKVKDRVKEEELSDGELKREWHKSSDGVKEEDIVDGEGRGVIRKVDHGFKEKVKEEDFGYDEDMNADVSAERSQDKSLTGQSNGDRSPGKKDKSSSRAKVVALEKHNTGTDVPNVSSPTTNYSHPIKVSFTTTNENEGVNIIRSDEVPGKSSTDGTTTSVAGRSGSLSLDALAKAKRALQMQKELAEKMKKIPALGKLSSSTTNTNSQVEAKKEIHRVPSALPATASMTMTAQTKTGTPSLPGTAAAVSSSKSSSAGNVTPLSGLTVEAVKRAQEVAARMGFRQDPQFAPLINIFPGPVADVGIAQKPSKAPVLRLDAQGREIDEHGNVINVPKMTNLSTLKVNINKQKKEAFQILRPELDANLDSNPHFDERMGVNKTKLLRPKRMTFQFVEEGKWSRQAEITRFKSQFGEAQAKELKTKQAQLAKAKAEPDINPNLIEISERVVIKEKQKDPIPEIEWWDLPILPSGSYDDIKKDRLNMEKITIYVEHPLPIQPPAEPAPPPPQPLKLTKKENKKLRTQRRLAKERDRQEMIRQGLIEPPKPKVKMSNLMRVLGTEATQDPTRLEMEIRSAAAEREQAHFDRNIARKLTPAERREKKERKLFEDPNTLETVVTVYKVNHLSHPKTRFQVDVNAQENRLTGCAVISDDVAVVVVEGGKKSNKRYKNLMMKRIDWSAVVENEEHDDENPDSPVNKCLLVWQGSVAKPSFNRFLVHQCRTEAAARKVFADAGVPHYWDLAVNYSDELM